MQLVKPGGNFQKSERQSVKVQGTLKNWETICKTGTQYLEKTEEFLLENWEVFLNKQVFKGFFSPKRQECAILVSLNPI